MPASIVNFTDQVQPCHPSLRSGSDFAGHRDPSLRSGWQRR